MNITPDEWLALWISLKVASVAVAVCLPFAVMSGYLLARWNGTGKSLVEIVVNLPLVLPPVVSGYLLLIVFSKNNWMGSWIEQWTGIRLTFSWQAASLAAAVISFPLMARAIRIAFEHVDPRLESAARSMGAGWIDTFFSISAPLALRGIIAGCVLGFARSLGEFGATIMIAGNIKGETQTIPLAIFSLVQRPGGLEQSWRLVCLSIILASLALIASEWLERRGKTHESA